MKIKSIEESNVGLKAIKGSSIGIETTREIGADIELLENR